MKLRDIFVSTAAAATLALGLSVAPAFAQNDQTDNPAPPTTTTEVTNSTTLEWDPLLPPWAVLGFGSAVLLLGGLAASQRMRGTFAFAAAGGLVALTLANPQLVTEQKEMLPTTIAVIVDHTASQTIGGRTTTTESMQAALIEQFSHLENVDIRIIDVTGQENGNAVNGSNLFKALTAGVADVPQGQLGAVYILTDGQVHDVPDQLSSYYDGVPVHVLVSGQENEIDRSIVINNAQTFGLVGKQATISFSVVDKGALAGAGPVRVTVTADGQPLSTLSVNPGGVTTFTLDIPHAGANLIEFRAEGIDGELTDVNNKIVVSVEGIREQMRVLLVSGEAYNGERTWRDLLKSDPDLDLVHFTILRPPGIDDETNVNELALISFPTRQMFSPEALNEFDLVIFDRYQTQGVLPPIYLRNIADYVNEGGSLLVVAGPEYNGAASPFKTPLGMILPAKPDAASPNGISANFRPEISELGLRHPVTRGLGSATFDPALWGQWYAEANVGEVTGSTVLNGANEEPLLVLNRQGEGRVGMLLSDNAWLWDRGHDGGGPYKELVQRVSHWLMGEPSLEEEALRLTANQRTGELTIEQQTLGETSSPVTLRSPSGEVITVTLEAAEPGLYRATVKAEELGLYQVDQNGRSSFASIGPASPLEFKDTISTTAILQPVAESSGGYIGRMIGPDGQVDAPIVKTIDSTSAERTAGDGWTAVREGDGSLLKGLQKTPVMAYGLPATLAAFGLMFFLQGGGRFRGRDKKDTPGGNTPAP